MSKNFEEEYKNMVAGDLPDLWDRIEAGLHEKEVKEVKPVTTAEVKPVTATEFKTLPPVKKKKTIYKILPWAGAIATAALVLIVAIPAVILVNRVAKMKNASPTAMANMNYVMQETAEDSAFEEREAAGAIENAAEPEGFLYDGSTMGLKGTMDMSGLADDRKKQTGGQSEAVMEEENLKNEIISQPESNQEGNIENRVYARVLEVYEKDGKTYCMAEISDTAEVFKSDLQIEAGEFVISSESEVEAEPFSINVAVFDGDELKLLFRMER